MSFRMLAAWCVWGRLHLKAAAQGISFLERPHSHSLTMTARQTGQGPAARSMQLK